MSKRQVKILILVIVIGIIAFLCLNSREIVNFTSNFKNARMGENQLLSYMVYDNQDSSKIKILINVYADDIIEYVEKPDGNIINGNGKNNIYIDYETALNSNNEFKIKVKNNNEITKKFVVNEESYSNYVELEDKELDIVSSIFFTKIKNIIIMDNDAVYYKVANSNSQWTLYNEKILLKESDITYDNDGAKINLNLKKVDQSGNIIYLDKEIRISKLFDSSVTFSTEYGTIDVIWLDTENNVISEPNSPENSLVSGGEALRPVTFNTSTNSWKEVTLPTTDSWYDYSQKKWANVMTATTDNSFFVWIPRYAYRITYYGSADTTGQPTGYYDGLGMWRAQDGKVKYGLDKGIETVDYDGKKYIVHPAFATNLDNGGWSTNLPGFWFSKYDREKARTIGELYRKGRQATYGYTGTRDEDDGYTSFMNSHMSKNSEWGAMVYLTLSQYGSVGTYGIADLDGRYQKRVAIFNSTDTNGFYSKQGWTIKNSTKYATKYDNITDMTGGNIIIYNYGKIGDATKEVYKGGAYDGLSTIDKGLWFQTSGGFVYSDFPFLARYGNYGLSFDAREDYGMTLRR